MPVCYYKKAFLKDLAEIPARYRTRIERLVFETIPAARDIFSVTDISLMKGHSGYYRIREGKYRIGCKLIGNGEILFYRVKSREEIYRVFP
jgi:mRNA-degrading endonuclease RelE of RelBE toxin-antitoxin system